MAAVNKVLNMVFACEIRGRLRCSATSIGYRGRIRKPLVHSSVTRLSWNCCQARNYRCRPFGIAAEAMPTGSRQHARCYELSAWICALHAVFLPFARFYARSDHLTVVNQTRRAVRFVGWPTLRRWAKAQNAHLARGTTAQHLCPRAAYQRVATAKLLTLLSVLHCGPCAAPGPAALALAGPVATVMSQRGRAAARSDIRSAGTRSASRELRSAIQRRRPRSARSSIAPSLASVTCSLTTSPSHNFEPFTISTSLLRIASTGAVKST
jgi:hypothetical protein